MHQKMLLLMVMMMEHKPDEENEIEDIDPAGEYESGDNNGP